MKTWYLFGMARVFSRLFRCLVILLPIRDSILSHIIAYVNFSLQWSTISAGVPRGSVLDPLFFLVYINDLIDNVNSDVKMFADDTSLFSTVTNETVTAEVLNRDLEKV